MRHRNTRFIFVLLLSAPFLLGVAGRGISHAIAGEPETTAHPIQHVVVIFQENVSFDHYFATYPQAANAPGEPEFRAAPGTPSINGLSGALMTGNVNADNPFRFSRQQALTCDQNHGYTAEQKAFNGGLMNQFVQAAEGKPSDSAQYCPKDAAGNYDAVMGYYDGNTVTAIWNYAQHFAMNQNSYGTVFGPSTPGALNLISGDTSPALCGPQHSVYGAQPACGEKGALPAATTSAAIPSNGAYGSVVGDPQPYLDICSRHDASAEAVMGGRNVGDLLNRAGVTWGWFQGGFSLSKDGTCSSQHVDEAFDAVAGVIPTADPRRVTDYIPHHEPFQYFVSTANPSHLEPTSVDMVGRSDRANHQYDLSWFWKAAESGNLPAVSFVKAAAYQDGHAGYSDPLDEQRFLVDTINRLQRLPDWSSTAIIISYDDSDGWYDHVQSPIVNGSTTQLDIHCGVTSAGAQARCGYGPRLPLLVISPYARQNFVSSTLTDQTSILRFIEDIWLNGQRISDTSFDNIAGSLLDMFDFSQTVPRTLLLDPVSGRPVEGQP